MREADRFYRTVGRSKGQDEAERQRVAANLRAWIAKTWPTRMPAPDEDPDDTHPSREAADS